VLERDDRPLVRADSGLPGLALVLDPEAVHEQVATAVGAAGLRLVSSAVEYLRYKPGTSVVATVRVRTDEGSCLGYVRAWSGERGAPAPVTPEVSRPTRRFRAWPPLVDEEAMLAVAPAGADLRLRGVGRVLLDSRRWVRRMDLDEDARPADLSVPVAVRELRYKPGRRWVARVDVDGCPWGVVKSVRRPALEHAVRAVRQAAGAGAAVAAWRSASIRKAPPVSAQAAAAASAQAAARPYSPPGNSRRRRRRQLTCHSCRSRSPTRH
jgi:hypothetical protein